MLYYKLISKIDDLHLIILILIFILVKYIVKKKN